MGRGVLVTKGGRILFTRGKGKGKAELSEGFSPVEELIDALNLREVTGSGADHVPLCMMIYQQIVIARGSG